MDLFHVFDRDGAQRDADRWNNRDAHWKNEDYRCGHVAVRTYVFSAFYTAPNLVFRLFDDSGFVIV